MERDVAIFTRNHQIYLDEACAIAKTDRVRRIAFRAVTRWVAAEKFLRQRCPRDMYISSIGADGVIDYMAELQGVLVDPEQGQPRTDEWLRLSLGSTDDEGLWEDSVGTLYLIANCRLLERPFPFTTLVKVSDNLPMSKDYGYSYSIVYAREPAQG